MHLTFAKELAAWAATLTAIFTYLFGGADAWFFALLSFVLIDLATGIIAAYIRHQWNSEKLLRGGAKKLLYAAVVAVACVFDNLISANGMLRAGTIAYLLAGEGLSILENCGKCGLPIPKKLLAALEQLHDDNE